MANAEAAPLLWVSFQDAWMGNDDGIKLTCLGTQADLRRQGLVLRERMAVRFYEDDLDLENRLDPIVADGVIRRDPETGRWWAAIGEVQSASALADARDHWCHRVDWAAEVAARRMS